MDDGRLTMEDKEKTIAEDLEKAAERYEIDNTIEAYGGKGSFAIKTLAEAFEAGAQWQKEQKPVDYEAELKKCKDNSLYFFDKYVAVKIKQKPVEWSEEDEHNLEYVIDCVYDFYPDPVMKYKLKDWLKSIREKFIKEDKQ